jgi:hypothetical protein
MYTADLSRNQKMMVFLKALREAFDRKDQVCHLVRGWNFSHNEYGRMEIELRRRTGFVFLNRGISFVWKSLDEGHIVDPREFILSRIAAQGVY